jgi:hypothetical protein
MTIGTLQDLGLKKKAAAALLQFRPEGNYAKLVFTSEAVETGT